jgi:hypothetical protein
VFVSNITQAQKDEIQRQFDRVKGNYEDRKMWIDISPEKRAEITGMQLCISCRIAWAVKPSIQALVLFRLSLKKAA